MGIVGVHGRSRHAIGLLREGNLMVTATEKTAREHLLPN